MGHDQDLMASVHTERKLTSQGQQRMLDGRRWMEGPHPTRARGCTGNKAHLATSSASPIPSPCCHCGDICYPHGPSSPCASASAAQQLHRPRCAVGSIDFGRVPIPETPSSHICGLLAVTPSAARGEEARMCSHSR